MSHYISAGIFIFASITDYIDGFLARYWQVQTNFGRMLDPIADKMLVASTLLLLVDQQLAPTIPIVIILCREIFVSGMREYLGVKSKKIPVKFIGKIKTFLQMAAIIIILLGDVSPPIASPKLGEILLWIASIMTLISGYLYCKEGFKDLN
jgi:CDP-diacylglycerol--glycerol-3-phosphate 3-phosphatidyltransferase